MTDKPLETFTYSEETLAKLWPDHTGLMASCKEKAEYWQEHGRAGDVTGTFVDLYLMIARLAALGRGR